MKNILTLLLIIIITQALPAQQIPNPATVDVNALSDSQLQRIVQEVQSRGLTLDQAVTMAKAQGASQTQIDQLTARIQNLAPAGIENQTSSVSTVTGAPATVYSTPKAHTTVSEKTKKVFGYQLFNSDNLTFEPGVNIPVPQNYVLGIGDQLTINVWGASQSKVLVTIEKNGAINIPDVGPVHLAGLSFEKGVALIKSRLTTIYNGMGGATPNTWAEVTIGNVHSIKINVLGEINAPGTYTLPSTASAFNALYLSGGPNENGTFREIRLIRDGVTVRTLDIYDFLIKGDPAANAQLREQDILFVPNYKARAEIAGEVKHPGIFEIKTGETLSDLIRFAGGFADKAYTFSLSMERNNTKEREVRTVLHSEFDQLILQNGDLVRADAILDRFSNRVAITGAVFHPGNYEFAPGMKLSDLIQKADGLREEAFMNRGLIVRLKEDNTPENLSFVPKEIVKGTKDILLKREDQVMISSIFDLREAWRVSIKGEVANPESYAFQEKMTLSDLIYRAGGFRENADPAVIEVTRRLSYDEAARVTDKMNEILQFSIPRDLKLTPADAAFELKPFDEVYVRRAPGYREQGTFVVTGEVVYAGTYALAAKNERISDAIKRAGGLVPGAFLNGATLTRFARLSATEINKKKQLTKLKKMFQDTLTAGEKSYPVGINLAKIMAQPGGNADLLLQPGDIIDIPRELQTVKISGEVMNPIALTFEKRLSLGQYIDRAGGYTELARRSKSYVIYPNGTTASRHGFLFKWYPNITPGSEVIVPRKPEKKQNDNAMKWVSMASAISSLSIALVTLVNLTK